ncbi:MAG: hypothetical protein ACLFPE_10275 [Bacteroidales bacterium]
MQKIGSGLKFDTWGFLAIANFLVCVLSGIFLAVPFDVNDPFASITQMLLTNPGAVFLRNAHYWSAQFFLIFTILHTWEYLKVDRTHKTRPGVWLRLVVSLVFVFYVMISGFILKADMDSLQARRIIDSLALTVPLIGNLLSYSLIGPEGDFQLLYVHHIATATIFLAIIILEHARTIWTKARTFLLTAIFVSAVSLLFRAPLHDNITPVVKGPWYFLGLQEILHWMTHPGWLLLILFAYLVLTWLVPKLRPGSAGISRQIILYSFYFYMVLTVVAYFFRGENWSWDWRMQDVYSPVEVKTVAFGPLADTLVVNYAEAENKREGCIVCHAKMTGFAASHDPVAIGCASCHLGDPYTLDKDLAHQGMINIPGNLLFASRTCGTADCHPEITDRIQSTLMTTLSGVVSVDRFVFNEAEVPGVLSRITEIGHTPADQHLRDLCANCHLGNEKTSYGPIDQLTRGGGCNACHLNYSEAARAELFRSGDDAFSDTIMMHHPALSLEISNDHCFGCHSRSGRLSTNYEGWHETLLEADEMNGRDDLRLLQDQRVFEYIGEDVHHAGGMDCIDCHNSYEAMGDGNLYTHEEFQVKVRCEDCHFHGPANTLTAAELDQETYKILQLRGYPEDRRFLKIEKSGTAMVNTWADESGNWLVTKNSGKILPMIAPAEICTQGGAHGDLSCESCHTAWAPQCIGCHNAYESDLQGYDLLENRYKPGSWVEFTGMFLADPPALGVDTRTETTGESGRKINTFINGMVLSIDMESYDPQASAKEIFHRLYAPTAAHTTVREGRSCKSCHNDPLAIGYGRGKLEYVHEGQQGRWEFSPRFAPNKYDGLPEDAWIGFLQEPAGWTTTREGTRPFNIQEQKSMLTVGACLTCHEEDSPLMLQSLGDFEKLLKNVSEECLLPGW